MEFRVHRLLLVYLSLALCVLCLSLLHIVLVHKLRLGLPIFLIALGSGSAAGLFASLRTWPGIDGFLVESEHYTQWQFLKLLGPPKYQWYLVLLLFSLGFLFVIKGNKTLELSWVLFYGVLHGIGMSYFLTLTFRVSAKERTLRREIFVKIQSG